MASVLELATGLAFDLTPEHEATEPPEARGLARDDVCLMVSWRSGLRLEHDIFRDLAGFLAPGDLIVVNTSATIPAAVRAIDGAGTSFVLHLSTRLPGDLYLVELRRDGKPFRDGTAGSTLVLPAGASADLLTGFAGSERLWVATLH